MRTSEILHQRILDEKKARILYQKNGKRDNKFNLYTISKLLDEYYCLNKLQTFLTNLSINAIVYYPQTKAPSEGHQIFIDEIRALIQKGKIETPLTYIYYYLTNIFLNLDAPFQEIADDFNTLLRFLKANESKFSKVEQMEVYSFLTNFCVKKLNSGEKILFENCFRYNNKIINLWYSVKDSEHSNLPTSIFKNIIVAATNLSDSDEIFNTTKTEGLSPDDPNIGFKNYSEWCQKFISVYASKLQPTAQEDTIAYCSALLAFQKEDYLQAFNILQHFAQSRQSFINFNLKQLFLIVTLEMEMNHSKVLNQQRRTTGRDVGIKAHIDSFRKAIEYERNRKQIMNYQLDYFITFFRLFKKLEQFYNRYHNVYGSTKNPKFHAKKEELTLEIANFKSVYTPWFYRFLNKIG